jgi:hypothetical protein
MAESYNTLAGLVQLNDKNLADLEMSDVLDGAPLLKVMAAQPASNGTEHKYLKVTTNPTAAFRAALDGVVHTASADTLVTVTLKILDASFDTDVALAQAYKGGTDGWLQLEQKRKLRAAFAAAEKQVFYGTGNDAAGFAGIIDGSLHDALADAMVVNAGGSNASTQTSCFLMRHATDGACIIIGNDGLIKVEEPTIIQKAGTSGATYLYPAWYVAACGYMGLQIGGAYDVARIANIECNDMTSTTAFDDDDIAAALSKFPAANMPNVIVMNRNALRLLRQSRSAYSPTGTPPPFPTEAFGVPIIVTDQIVSTEAVES